MSGNSIGRIKAKMGLKGTLKPGELLNRMNEMKVQAMKPDISKAKVNSTIKKII